MSTDEGGTDADIASTGKSIKHSLR